MDASYSLADILYTLVPSQGGKATSCFGEIRADVAEDKVTKEETPAATSLPKVNGDDAIQALLLGPSHLQGTNGESAFPIQAQLLAAYGEAQATDPKSLICIWTRPPNLEEELYAAHAAANKCNNAIPTPQTTGPDSNAARICFRDAEGTMETPPPKPLPTVDAILVPPLGPAHLLGCHGDSKASPKVQKAMASDSKSLICVETRPPNVEEATCEAAAAAPESSTAILSSMTRPPDANGTADAHSGDVCTQSIAENTGTREATQAPQTPPSISGDAACHAQAFGALHIPGYHGDRTASPQALPVAATEPRASDSKTLICVDTRPPNTQEKACKAEVESNYAVPKSQTIALDSTTAGSCFENVYAVSIADDNVSREVTPSPRCQPSISSDALYQQAQPLCPSELQDYYGNSTAFSEEPNMQASDSNTLICMESHPPEAIEKLYVAQTRQARPPSSHRIIGPKDTVQVPRKTGKPKRLGCALDLVDKNHGKNAKLYQDLSPSQSKDSYFMQPAPPNCPKPLMLRPAPPPGPKPMQPMPPGGPRLMPMPPSGPKPMQMQPMPPSGPKPMPMQPATPTGQKPKMRRHIRLPPHTPKLLPGRENMRMGDVPGEPLDVGAAQETSLYHIPSQTPMDTDEVSFHLDHQVTEIPRQRQICHNGQVSAHSNDLGKQWGEDHQNRKIQALERIQQEYVDEIKMQYSEEDAPVSTIDEIELDYRRRMLEMKRESDKLDRLVASQVANKVPPLHDLGHSLVPAPPSANNANTRCYSKRKRRLMKDHSLTESSVNTNSATKLNDITDADRNTPLMIPKLLVNDSNMDCPEFYTNHCRAEVPDTGDQALPAEELKPENNTSSPSQKNRRLT